MSSPPDSASQKIREMLRDPVVLAKIREVLETAPPGQLSDKKRKHYLGIVEAIEAEIADPLD